MYTSNQNNLELHLFMISQARYVRGGGGAASKQININRR